MELEVAFLKSSVVKFSECEVNWIKKRREKKIKTPLGEREKKYEAKPNLWSET